MRPRMIPMLITVCLTLGTGARAGEQPVGKQTSHTGRFEIEAPVERVFPLFDPLNEPLWSPDFKAKPIYPLPFMVAQDSVFTTGHRGGPDTMWVINAYDPVNYRIEYLLFKPGFQVRRISIVCEPIDSNHTAVTVTYRVTGVSEEGNRHASDYDQVFIAAWRPAIEAYIAASHARPEN